MLLSEITMKWSLQYVYVFKDNTGVHIRPIHDSGMSLDFRWHVIANTELSLPSSNKTPFSTVKSPIDTGKSSNTIQLFLKCFMTMVVVFWCQMNIFKLERWHAISQHIPFNFEYKLTINYFKGRRFLYFLAYKWSCRSSSGIPF
jgi:hypothetical protein